MTTPIPFLTDPKYTIWRNVFFFIVLVFIAFGHTPFLSNTVGRSFLIVQIPVYVLMYVATSFLNVYLFVPRLLLQGKYFSYTAALLSTAAFLILTTMSYEWVLHSIYHVPKGGSGYFSDNRSLILSIFSNLVTYFIAFVAMSLIVSFRHLLKSGERIRYLEESGVGIELARARSKVDSGSLFELLNEAAAIAVSAPDEASRILMQLSKSLRRQLYESDKKQVFSTFTEKRKQMFHQQHSFLNIVIEKRYRLARNLLLLLISCLIGGASAPSSWSEFAIYTLQFILPIYFNTYVLLPRLFLKNRFIEYIVALVFSIIVFMMVLIPPSRSVFVGQMAINPFILIMFISVIVKMGFIIFGTSAIVLFQRWARNERYIAQLETATMRAELEQLQNQINPHFLFNMLNNILVLIRENAEEAVFILHKMSDMLKYQFSDGDKKEVLLGDDIQFLTDFLNLEKIRRDCFEFTVTVENDAEKNVVPPLLFIPFVENAVKHSADAVNMSYIHLHFSADADMLHFTCRNSKPLKPARKNKYGGLGLVNIRRRLELIYGENHLFDIQEDETSYTVQLTIDNCPYSDSYCPNTDSL